MIAIIFEVEPNKGRAADHFTEVANLKAMLEKIEGFISVECLESVTTRGKFVSLSFWRDEDAARTIACALPLSFETKVCLIAMKPQR